MEDGYYDAAQYEILEHTADVGIIVRGTRVEELFEKAAYGMFDLMVSLSTVYPVGKYKVHIESPTLEDLLVDYLSELLYVYCVEYVVMSDFNVIIKETNEGYKLTGIALGEPLDKTKHAIKMEIKAVTYHELEINLKEGFVKVLFDI